MFHEDLKTDVVCEDGGSFAAAPALVIVGLARIYLAKQEPCLTSSLLGVNIPKKSSGISICNFVTLMVMVT